MSMEINSVYSSVYESTYTVKKSETEKQQTVSKDSADKTKQAGSVKNAYETNTSASQTTDIIMLLYLPVSLRKWLLTQRQLQNMKK